MAQDAKTSPADSHSHHRHIRAAPESTRGARFHQGSSIISTSITAIIVASLVAVIVGILFTQFPGITQKPSDFAAGSRSPRQQDSPSADVSRSITAPTMASVRRTAPLVFPAVGRHTATVIFAHGLGDTGNGWASAVEHWRRRQKLDEVKFVLPHAPQIPITVNGGMKMPGWFDIAVLGGSVDDIRSKAAHEDGPGILASREYFNSLIQAEVSAGVPADRIVLGGFSQGGAMSIVTGVTSPVKIAGIVGLSSWLLLSQGIKEHIPQSKPNKDTPIFMGHGDEDPMVRYQVGTESQKMLKELGYNVKLETYNGMGHSACLEELDEVEKFLAECLPAKGGN